MTTQYDICFINIDTDDLATLRCSVLIRLDPSLRCRREILLSPFPEG
jgi:hypothetical protein